MSLRRVLAPEIDLSGASVDEVVLLSAEFFHYVRRVLRLDPGEQIELCDGTRERWIASVEDEGGGGLLCKLIEKLPSTAELFPVFLAQGLPKSDRFDLILRQGTEIGISAFFPFTSKRSVVRPKSNKIEQKVERWSRIVREASRQCGRSVIPAVSEPVELADLIERLPPSFVCLVCWEEAEAFSLKDWLAQTQTPSGVVLVIGPEGGFAKDEVEKLVAKGAICVGLGPLILRTETAGIATASMIQFALGSLGGASTPTPFSFGERTNT